MRYLQGTKDYLLTFKRSDNLEVIGYSDSDFAGCIDSQKSTFGYLFMLARGAISWKSSMQTITATSIMEAKFAYPLTKGLPLKTFKEHVDRMGLERRT